MAVQAVLNELSCATPASSVQEANARMRQLLTVLRIAFREGAERGLRVGYGFYNVEVAPGLRALDWRNQPDIDEVEAEFFGDVVATLRLIDPELELRPELEFQYNGKPAIGLGVAYASDNLAISLASDVCWDTHAVQVKVLSLNELGDVISTVVSVHHAASESHIDVHTGWLRARANIVPFSSEATRIGIDRAIMDLSASGNAKKYDFSEDFANSVQRNGFFDDAGMLRHVLAESCARILLDNPKNAVSSWQTAELQPGWLAFRTHLTRAGPGYRLMFWQRPDGLVIFANVGPKFEEKISSAVRENLLDP